MSEYSNSSSPQAGWKNHDASCYIYVGMYVGMHICMYVKGECACEYRCLWNPEVSDTLEMGLEEFVNPLVWVVLRTELGSSTKVILLTTESYIPPALCLLLLIQRQKPWEMSYMKWYCQHSPRNRNQYHNKPELQERRKGQWQRRSPCKPRGKLMHVPELPDSCL